METKSAYFDFAATAKPDEEILKNALDCYLENWGNPSSLHNEGVKARKALEDSRQMCAQVLGVKPSQVFFTSGGTESDHIPLLSVVSRPQKGSVLISSIEHPALREMKASMENAGWKVLTVNPDKNGFVKAEDVVSKLEEDTAFVSVMAVNNETGAVQDIYKIAEELQKWAGSKRKPFFHVDCVQAAGKIELNLAHPGIDGASFSAHKIHGPKGAGLLYLKNSVNPFLRGGGQESGIRSGTENVFASRAFALCLKKYYISEANADSVKRLQKQKEMTESFLKGLSEIKGAVLIPKCRLTDEYRNKFSPWIVQCAFPGIPGQVMLRALNSEGICISTGSACSSGKKGRPVLDTMALSPQEKESAVRFSFGFSTTEDELNLLLLKIREICSKFTS